MKVKGFFVVALAGVKASALISSFIRNVAELIGPVSELADPQGLTGSVEEVTRSAEKSLTLLSEASVTQADPGGLSGVIVRGGKSAVPELKVAPCVQIIDPVNSASLWLSSNKLMGCKVSEPTTGTIGEVGSGLVLGLKGYGVSNKLPAGGKMDRSHR